MTNLKQCPFCGGEAERIDIPAEHDDIENAGASCIQCSRCVASTALHFDRKENLESSWNDRKPATLAAMGLSEKYLSLESNDCLRPPMREVLCSSSTICYACLMLPEIGGTARNSAN